MRVLGANRMTEVRCKNIITRHRRGVRERERDRYIEGAKRERKMTKG